MLILLATEKPFAADAVKQMTDLATASGHELHLLEKYASKTELLNAVSKADALIVRSDTVDAEVIAAGKNLKVVVRAGAGYDNIDLKAATAAQICVMNTPGQNANAVAEMVFGAMIFQARNHFDGSSGTELRGKSLGLIGLGNIGKRMAEIARGFEMRVYVHELYPNPELFKQLGITEAKTDTIFKTCDFVSLHVPSTPETKGMVSASVLNTMKNGAMLVNAARQDLVNEAELAAVMNQRKDLTYVTDFIPKDEGLLNGALAKRLFYPAKKMGAQTEEANVNAGLAAVRQIAGFFATGDERFRVN